MLKIADQVEKLGTETAYAVALSASQYAAEGHKVYPFHIGDVNIKTSPLILEAAKKALDEGRVGYCPAAGIPELREEIAREVTATRGVAYNADEVSIQPGGKPVIGKFVMTLMNLGDEVLYPNPGYPIYESMINFHGGVAVPYVFKETADNFVLDLDYLKSHITPKTKLLIYNNYQNPMGCCSSAEEMAEIARLAVEHDLYVLADEAYYDMVYDQKPVSIVSLPGMRERTVILYTFSKKFAMTGWRLGAAIGPKEVIDVINKLNTNDEACTCHFVQYAGLAALKDGQEETLKLVQTFKERRDVLLDALKDVPGIGVFKPEATFYLFVNVTELMEKMGLEELEDFRLKVLQETGVSFCTREHFGCPLPHETQKYIRLAYSGIEIDQIQEGMAVFKKFAESFF